MVELQLKSMFSLKVDQLASGLALHERLASPSLKPFQDKMVMMFARMRESIETGTPIEVCTHNQISIQTGSVKSASNQMHSNRPFSFSTTV